MRQRSRVGPKGVAAGATLARFGTRCAGACIGTLVNTVSAVAFTPVNTVVTTTFGGSLGAAGELLGSPVCLQFLRPYQARSAAKQNRGARLIASSVLLKFCEPSPTGVGLLHRQLGERRPPGLRRRHLPGAEERHLQLLGELLRHVAPKLQRRVLPQRLVTRVRRLRSRRQSRGRPGVPLAAGAWARRVTRAKRFHR